MNVVVIHRYAGTTEPKYHQANSTESDAVMWIGEAARRIGVAQVLIGVAQQPNNQSYFLVGVFRSTRKTLQTLI